MQTKLIDMTETINEEDIKTVVQLLRRGELVAFPTETVYGLGADATNETAVNHIFKAKGRPSDNPLIVHVATKEQLLTLTEDVPDYVEKLIDAFSPGPITYVLKSAGHVANVVTAGLSTVGIRIPDHRVALAIISACKKPIAAPSANRSGKPSPTKAAHVVEDLYGKIACIVDGGGTDIGIESTVVDCTRNIPLILRPGAITAKQIANIVGACHTYEKKEPTEQPKSPGLKYVHYAPEVPLMLVKKEQIHKLVYKYKREKKRIALLYETDKFKDIAVEKTMFLGRDEATMAQHLYEILRSLKKDVVDIIVCELPSFSLDSALIDRLKRAATEVIM